MKRPRIQRIRRDYTPGYPKQLTPDEFRTMLAPEQQRRILAAAAAASVAFGAATAQDGQGPHGKPDGKPDRGREARVLELLSHNAGGSSFWFQHTTFQRSKDARGVPSVVPQIPISFGNSYTGVFDAERARKLARDLFAIYGLKPVADHDLKADGITARLDVYDPAVQVGCKIRGVMPTQQGMAAQVGKEPPATDLDDQELARLAAQGHRIHAANLDAFPVMDGDRVTPTFAYLAGIVDFLNSVTGGPDVDLLGIVARHEVRLPLPEPAKVPTVMRVVEDEGNLKIHARKPAALTFQIDPSVGAERRTAPQQRFGEAGWDPASKPMRAPGAVLLRVPSYPAVVVEIAQGDKLVRARAAGSLLFLPAHFDPNRPFALTVHFEQAGDYRLESHVVLGGILP